MRATSQRSVKLRPGSKPVGKVGGRGGLRGEQNASKMYL